ncbi:hypothetical protein O206_20050 [Ochrobactrum sp. EGD-AQ16]|nr:hypothetical protein O206_20050 [Ochrobactrum sp. EGD-AQ16]
MSTDGQIQGKSGYFYGFFVISVVSRFAIP